MIDALSVRQQRLVALALLGGALAALWLALINPIIEHIRASSEERWSELRALSRDRALVSQAPSIRAAITSLERSPRWGRLYDTQKPDQATLQLETDLRALFKASNTLTSMTAEPTSPQGSLTRIAVKVTLSMSIDQWTEALGTLQLHSRLLQIDSLTVQAPDFQTVDTNPKLSIQAEIVGFMLTPKART